MTETVTEECLHAEMEEVGETPTKAFYVCKACGKLFTYDMGD